MYWSHNSCQVIILYRCYHDVSEYGNCWDLQVAVWHHGKSINKVTLCQANLVLRWWLWVYTVLVSSHSGQLSLLPSVGQEMCIGQGTVAVLCGQEGNRRCNDVAKSVSNRPWCIYTHWLNDLGKGNKQPTYAPIGPWHVLYLFTNYV